MCCTQWAMMPLDYRPSNMQFKPDNILQLLPRQILAVTANNSIASDSHSTGRGKYAPVTLHITNGRNGSS